MACRANYIVVRNGFAEAHTSRWGGPHLESLLTRGPEAVATYVTVLDRGNAASDAECEAAALLDFDERFLLYFSRHTGGYAGRMAVLSVLEHTWPGWRVEWAYDGYASLGTRLHWTGSHWHEPAPFRPLTPAHDRVRCLVTVAGPYGLRAYALADPAPDVLDQGHPLDLPDEARVTALATLPDGGVHLNTATRSAGVWSILPLWGALDRTSVRWPGWRWTMWRDRYADHRARASLTWPEPDLSAAYAALRENEKDPSLLRLLDELERSRMSG